MKVFKSIVSMLLIFILCISLVGCGGEDVESSEYVPEDQVGEEASSEEPQEQRSLFYLNEYVSIGDIVIRVIGLNNVEGDEFFGPEEGNRYLAANVEMYNVGTEFQLISSMLGFEIQDTEAYTYSPSFMTTEKFGLDGSIPPGMHMVGSVTFEVPEEAIAETFIFDYDWLGGGQALINVDPANAVEDTSFENPQPPCTIASIGDVLQFNDANVIVNSTRIDTGNDYFGPDEGMIYVVADLTIENTSSESISASSLISLDVFDQDGHYSSISMFADTKGDIDGEISPGQKKRGEMAFEVLEDAEELYLLLDYDWLESDPKVVKIK